jgi:hypothetical protein
MTIALISYLYVALTLTKSINIDTETWVNQNIEVI